MLCKCYSKNFRLFGYYVFELLICFDQMLVC
jgi:hypothetical protein